MTLVEFFAGHEKARCIFNALHPAICTLGPCEIHVTKSQIRFRRRSAFAWAWVPDKYLRGGHAPLVLTLSFKTRHSSPRWKEIVEPVPGRFTHHLEFHAASEIDDHVRSWRQDAWQAAA